MQFLIVGLGNPGNKYQSTRHNIGFRTLDHLAHTLGTSFATQRYGQIATGSYRGRTIQMLKPDTFMNASGKAVRYWLKIKKIPHDRLLVVVDELALPLNKLKLRMQGSAAGHNGTQNIIDLLQTDRFARIRVGIGNNYPRGKQAEYVLAPFTADEEIELANLWPRLTAMITAFCFQGATYTMNHFH